MAPSSATPSGTTAFPSKQRITRKSATPASVTPNRASKSTPLKENVTPKSTPLKKAAPKSTPSATPDRTPDAPTPSSSQIGERHSARARKQTPRAIESWALNKHKRKENRDKEKEHRENMACVIEANDRYFYHNSKPQTESDAEAEAEAEHYDHHQRKMNNTAGNFAWPVDLGDHKRVLDPDDEGTKLQRIVSREKKTLKRVKKRQSLMKEIVDDTMDTADESEAILYEPKSTPKRGRKRRAEAVEESGGVELMETNLSPSKKAGNKRQKCDNERSKMVEDSLSRSRVVVNKKAADARKGSELAEVEENGESHAAMLERLEKARAAKTNRKKGRRKHASMSNLRNVNASSTKKSTEVQAFETMAGGEEAEAEDTNNDSDATSTPAAPQPQRRTRRFRSLPGGLARDGSHAKSTRSSAEPSILGAHLDDSGQRLEYEACPYYIPFENQALSTYPIAYNESKTPAWKTLQPCRVKIVEDGRRKVISGHETVDIDKSLTKLDFANDYDTISIFIPDPLAQRRSNRRKSSSPLVPEKLKDETQIQAAKILDAREGADGKTYLMVAWYWTRDEVRNQLHGYSAYMNRRWPRDKPWLWMLGAVFDVVCVDAVVRRVRIEGDERYCKEMMYGGEALNYEIFGREVGRDRYHLDGTELNWEDRDTYYKHERKKRRGEGREYVQADVEKERLELEVQLRMVFHTLWPPEEVMRRWREEVVRHDGVQEQGWSDGEDAGAETLPTPKSEGDEMDLGE